MGQRVRAAGTAIDPIRSRETPAQHARTSFRHPQVYKRDGGTSSPSDTAASTTTPFILSRAKLRVTWCAEMTHRFEG